MSAERARVVVSDSVREEFLAPLRQEGFDVVYEPDVPAEKLAVLVADAQALVVRSRTKVTRDLIAAAPKLRVVGRAGTGVDNIDVDAATQAGIVVMNTPAENTVSTAEHTIAMLLSLVRHVPRADRSVRAGEWSPSRFVGTEVRGKTLGIVGVGRVGREVASIARGLGMETLGFDPFLAPDAAASARIELVSLDDLLRRADVVTLHTPLVPGTKHLISAAELAKCKAGVRVVNCARGGLLDEEALLRAIESGHVAGAALDVFEQEPPKDRRLVERPEVVATPHLGASTQEAQKNVAEAVVRQVIDFLVRGVARGAVNTIPVEPEMLPKLRPWLDLAERLGSLQAQLVEGRLHGVVAEYHGGLSDLPTKPLTAAVVKGVLKHVLDAPVNEINAFHLARERGIQLSEVNRIDHGDFASLLSVTFETDQGSRTVSGTLFGKSLPRIVRLDGYVLDASPEGHLLVCQNEDLPGMIGLIGTILGNHGVNIASMALGRVKSGGKALAVLNLDQAPAPDVVRALRACRGFDWVKPVRLS
jgi:D-3-phosphoglycerate dehydrogenase / 2-oxoglutarate reductase